MGERKRLNGWAAMRCNGVKTTNSWSDAYYTAFTLDGLASARWW